MLTLFRPSADPAAVEGALDPLPQAQITSALRDKKVVFIHVCTSIMRHQMFHLDHQRLERSETWTKTIHPCSKVLMANIDPALVKKAFDMAKREWKPDVHHHELDDCSRCLEIAKKFFLI